MVTCDLIGLIRFIEKVDYISTSDSGYLYTVISYIISKDKNVIILQGKTDIPSLINSFKVSDRTNVIRILDRLVDTGLLQYTLAEKRGNESVYIIIENECAKYFFQK